MLMVAIAFALLALATSSQAHQKVDPRILGQVPDRPSDEIRNQDGSLDNPGRIRRGRELFGTPFGLKGNDRTCLTCHEPTVNFTLTEEFIATLPPSSPLFISERIPRLAFLEDLFFLRQGLICESLDGFDMPCVFRAIPHTFGMRFSITPDAGTATRAPFPLANATGWSGDGAPNSGAFVNFALGAIVQHETGDRDRIPGQSFRLPSKQQLRQMEAFQLSLGQQALINLDGVGGPAMVLADPTAEAGKALFVNGAPGRSGTIRSCNSCHNDAGANDADGNNRQFNTGVSRHPNAPTCLGNAPGDGGFGAVPVNVITTCNPGRSATFRGDGAFNTPSLIPAADTGPWFHNNIVVGEIERTIDQFYESDTFNNSPSGGGNAFVFTPTQVNQLGALLRALNARQNVINSISVTTRAVKENKARGDLSIREARSETTDAIGVLQGAPVTLFPGSNIVPLLGDAARLQLQAIGQAGAARKGSLNTAISRLRQALPMFQSAQ